MIEYFQLFFSNTYDASILIDLSNNQIIDCNQTALDLFEYEKKSAVIGSVWYELNFVRLSDDQIEEIKRLLQDKGKWKIEMEVFTSKGGTFQGRMIITRVEFESNAYYLVRIEDISELKESQQLLSQSNEIITKSERKYRLLFEHNLAGVFITNIAGEIIECNASFAHIFGYSSREEILKVTAYSLYFDRKDRINYITHLRKHGSVSNFELRHKKKDGNVIWILGNVKLIKDDITGEERIEGTLVDITNQKKKEEEIKMSQESFKNLAEYSPDGILIHVDGKIIYCNDSALKLLGIPNKLGVLGKQFKDLVLPKYKGLIENRIQLLKESKQPKLEEIEVLQPSGYIAELEIQSGVTNYLGKEAIQVLLHNVKYRKQLSKEKLKVQIAIETNKRLEEEINEHKKTQQELAKTQEFTTNVFDSSLDMVISSDMHGNISDVSNSACKVFGYDKHEMVGQSSEVLTLYTKQI